VALVFETTGFFASKMLQSVHGYTPAQVTLLYLTAGVAAPIGNIVAGALGDRFGRKRIMIAGIILNAVAVYVFYNAPGGIWVPIGWSLGIFSATLVGVLFAALGAELFPTSYRSTASGVRAVVGTGAAAVGLVIEGFLYDIYGSHNAAITALLVVAPIGPIVGWIFLPETASRELEEISPEVEAK
jgi:MFS family permease